jgi:hypothetical protein
MRKSRVDIGAFPFIAAVAAFTVALAVFIAAQPAFSGGVALWTPS